MRKLLPTLPHADDAVAAATASPHTLSWSNGINLGAYSTDTTAKDASYTF